MEFLNKIPRKMPERLLCSFGFISIAFPLDQTQHLLLDVVLRSNDLIYIEETFADSLTIHAVPDFVFNARSVNEALIRLASLIDLSLGNRSRRWA